MRFGDVSARVIRQNTPGHLFGDNENVRAILPLNAFPIYHLQARLAYGRIVPAEDIALSAEAIHLAGYVFDSGGYGLAAFRGAGALASASGSGTRASRAVQGDRPTGAAARAIS